MRLIVVDRTDDVLHRHRGTDLGDDGLRRLVGAGSLVQGGRADRPGRHALHVLLEVLQSNLPVCVRAGEKTSRPVRGGPVPVRVPFPDADKRAVPHVHRDDHTLSLPGGDGTFPENHALRVQTGVLNEIMTEAVAMQQPPTDKGKRLKLFYITQVSVKPPTFVIFVNDKELMHFSYTRYIENRIRDAFGFRGTPLHFIIRERKENA